MTPDASIIERIRKLLRLARDAGASEAEATLAAEKAQALLDEHRLSMSDLGEAPSDGIGMAGLTGAGKERWHKTLMRAVAETSGAYATWYPERRAFVLFGDALAIGAAIELYAFLAEQIERIARGECYGQRPSVKLAFKLGCATRVARRLRDAAKARQDAQPECRALVLSDPAKRAKAAAADMIETKPSRAVSTRIVNSEAFAAGVKAGDGVKLGIERKLDHADRKAIE